MVESTALTTTPQSSPSGALAFVQDAARTFAGIQQLANVMADMESAPIHLRGKPADCFRIVSQSAKWGMDPFSVAECTSLVHGRMCYEGKLVATVLMSMGAIVGRLEHEITGKGQDSAITITGTPRGGKRPCSISGTVRDWRTETKKDGRIIPNAWDKDPHSMLVYRGTRQWARLYAPEAILGVYTPDEFDDVREVEATVVHTDPPAARTAAPAATENGGPARPGTEQPSGGPPTGSSASAGGQSPAAGPAPHPALAAARDLFRAAEKLLKGTGHKVTSRLCALHGATEPKSIPSDRLDAFAATVAKAQAASGDYDQLMEAVSRMEADAAEAAREAAAGGAR